MHNSFAQVQFNSAPADSKIVPPPSTCAPHFPRYFLPDLFFLFSRRPDMYRAPSPTSVPVYITARRRKKPRRRRRSAHLRLAPLSVSSPPVSGVDKKTFSQSPPPPVFNGPWGRGEKQQFRRRFFAPPFLHDFSMGKPLPR